VLRERILAERLIAIVRLSTADALDHVADALVAGGISVLEITLTTPGALGAIAAWRARFGPDVLIGAGSVVDAAGARRSLDAGAQLLVSPVVQREVMEEADAAGVPVMPGAMTPTEIHGAHLLGADLVKVFPVRSLGPKYLADVLAPLPYIGLVPTGGVDAENAASFFAAGAVAVAVGGRLLDAASIKAQDWGAVTRRARALVEAVRAAPSTGSRAAAP